MNIDRIACEAGCAVVDTRGSGDERVARFDCGDGWAAARFLVGLAADPEDAEGVAAEARWLRARTQRETAERVFRLVSDRVVFEREAGELFRSPRVTLATRRGDCDCQARLVVALLRASGVPARFVFLGAPGGGPRHVVAQAQTERGWEWLETTVQGARFGEAPVTAAVRTGRVRDDVAPGYSEETIMGAIGVEGGNVYRMRLASDAVSAQMPANPEIAARLALLRNGFARVETYAEPPKDWRARDPVPGASWTVWAQAEYARPECRELGTLDVDESSGVVVDVVDCWLAVEPIIERANAIGEVAKGSGVAPPIVHTKDLSDKFFRDLKVIGKDLGIKAEHILAVMQEESGLRPSAGYRDGTNFASGLIQIVDLKGVGFGGTHDEFTKLSAEAQLPYVARFYKPYASLGGWNAERLLQVNFVPASLARGRSDYTVVVEKGGTGYNGQEARFYEINKGLDANRDGKITLSDLKAKLQRAQLAGGARWIEALARLRAAPDPEPAPVGAAIGILLAVGLAFLAKS